MSGLSAWAAMGGYAAWVWSAYAVTVVVLVGLLVASLRSLAARTRELARLEAEAGRRRGPGRAAP